jgi:simple sugar transport system substrate-binding protein/ribose transport system substrate-binding protein
MEAKDIVVAGVVFQDDQFMKSMVQGFEDAGKKLGVKQVIIGNSSNDQAKETELINTYMSQGVNGIAIAPLSPTVSMAALKQANDKGVAVALTNSGGFTDVAFITGGYMSDNTANGKAMGDAAAKYIKDAGLTGTIQVGIVDYDHQKPEESKLRYGGFEEGLKAAGVDYKVVAHQSAEKQDTALSATSDMITANPDIQVIFACNEGGSIGAAMAVKQAGKKIAVFGFDGSDQISSMIINGEMQAAIAQDPYGQGVAAMTDLVNYLTGKPGNSVGKLTIAPGITLSASDKAAVNAWRKANALKELEIPAAGAAAAPAAAAGGPVVVKPMDVKDIVVAGVVFQDDQFMKSMVQGFEDAGKKLGVKQVIVGNSSNDQAKETELINTYMSQGVNGIAIAPLSPTVSMAALKQANDKGVAVALTNSGGFTDVAFITGGYMSDNTANGKAMGDAAAKYIKDAGLTGTIQVGIVDYDHQKPEESKLRYGGFEEGLKAAGVDYKVVAHQSAEKQDTALSATSDMITANPDIQVIFACNEGGSIGAAMAVKQAGKKIAVFGFDGSDQISSMIINGEMQAAIAQDPYGQGVAAMTDLVNYLTGKPGNSVGKLTIAPGITLSASDKAAVNTWRVANGLKELPVK